LYRSEITAFFAYFGLNSVAMAIPSLSSLENLGSIFEFADPYNPVIHAKEILDILYATEISTILPKFGCHGNSLCSHKNSDSIFEFTYPENHMLHAKSVSISCTELKSVQYWLNFAQIWLP